MELTAERIIAGGAALAREPDGRVVFVDGALPGERVIVEITEERRDFARAHVIATLRPSTDRIQPPCRFVAAGCGGCGWQHIAAGAQRVFKAAIVKEALTRIGGLVDPDVTDGPDLPTTGYRTTVRVAVVDGRAAFRKSASHDLVPVDHCLVTHPLVDELLAVGRFGGASDVVLRAGVATGERLAWLRPSTGEVRLPADVALGERATIHETVLGRTFRISAPSFFQGRLDGAAAIVEAVRELCGPLAASDGVLVDAYAGVGVFAALLGQGRPSVLIELDRRAMGDARHNLSGRAATLVRGEVARWKPVPAELVVADPARPGLGRKAAATLAATRAQRIVLVSCDPASLGRDAKCLHELGYEHSRSVVIDLFSHTPHVEVVSSFAKR